MPKYQLKARFWDGARPHEVGSVLEFEEGMAPKGSVLLEELEPKAAPKATVKKD